MRDTAKGITRRSEVAVNAPRCSYFFSACVYKQAQKNKTVRYLDFVIVRRVFDLNLKLRVPETIYNKHVIKPTFMLNFSMIFMAPI